MTTTPTDAARVSGTIKALDRPSPENSTWTICPETLIAIRDAAEGRCDELDLEHVEAIALAVEARILAAIQPHPEPKNPDDEAVDRFAAAMKTKLRKKRAEGRSGWDGPECDANILTRLLREHVEKGDPLDVGNISMMLHQRGERIQTAPEPQPVAWIHTMHYEPGCGEMVSVTLDPDHPFGVPGKDFGASYAVTSQPLYATPSSAGTVSVEAAIGAISGVPTLRTNMFGPKYILRDEAFTALRALAGEGER
ncbi:hypothetical protein [Paracoccus sp. (in: a-proteobacteria)]|uniref:hypothetical protein n=1 Tax=Paracoccus sp. TaxID=267 RepID=UPI00289E3FCE|nr:hypothetical protein [Paracoccus sp. (in: a-proteobacteria)]